MKKNKEEIEEVEEGDRSVCTFMGFKIFTDSRQYSVFHEGTGRKDKNGKNINGKLLGYYGTLYYALGSIRQELMREATINSKTIEVVIDRIAAFDAKFLKALEPLKKIEDLDFKN